MNEDRRTFWSVAALTAVLGALLAAATAPQENGAGDRRVIRIHLKNGSVLEGESLRETGNRLILAMDQGEVSLRRETVDRVEVVRIRSKPPPPPPAAPRVRPQESPGEASAPLRERIDRILEMSRAASEDRRYELARELAVLGPSAVPHLVRRYESLDGPTQALVAGALIEARATLAPASLEPLVRSGKSGMRADGARMLGALGNPAATELLARLLRDLHPSVRAAAVQGLVSVGTREAFRILAPLCSDPDREVRLQSLRSLPALAEKNDCPEALDSALLDAFDRTRGEARADVVSVMGISGRERLKRFLVDALRDDSPAVRAAAVTALVNLGTRPWQESIVDRFLREEDSAVRMALAAAAPHLQSQAAIDPLISWLAGPDRNVAVAALRALKILTEQDFGLDAARWASWWDATKLKGKRRLP